MCSNRAQHSRTRTSQLSVLSPETGDQIRRKRQEVGITQHALATSIGISQPLLSKVECGHVRPPKALVEWVDDGRRENPRSSCDEAITRTRRHPQCTTPRLPFEAIKSREAPSAQIEMDWQRSSPRDGASADALLLSANEMAFDEVQLPPGATSSADPQLEATIKSLSAAVYSLDDLLQIPLSKLE